MTQLLSIGTDIKANQLPQAEAIKSVPQSRSGIDFHEKGNYYIVKIFTSPSKLANTRSAAKVLSEHIDIVEESRGQIANGNSMTWEEFVKTHAKTKRK